jgi:hypothetical protein
MIKSRVKFEFEFADPCLCEAWIATAVLGAGALGAAGSAYAANTAANAQISAANTAANTSLSMYNQTNANLAPFRNLGTSAASTLQSDLPSLIAPINMDETTLQNTPGYQFNLTQGLKATQNSAAARGLGTSGAALKGAATYATGLADSTYQNQFNNAVTNQTNAYNRLMGVVNTGENAAAQTGTAGTAAANTAASAQIGAGNAAAAGINAAGSAGSSLANNIAGYTAYKGLYGSSGSSSSGPITLGSAAGPTPFTSTG